MAMNITKTITTRVLTAIVFRNSSETLDTIDIVKCGEFYDGIDRTYDADTLICKVIRESKPITATYTMTSETYMALAEKSEAYRYGFINRKIGGDIARVIVTNKATLQTYETTVAKDTEKRMSKALEENNEILVKILDYSKTDEAYYFMSEETFIKYATVKPEKKAE